MRTPASYLPSKIRYPNDEWISVGLTQQIISRKVLGEDPSINTQDLDYVEDPELLSHVHCHIQETNTN